MKKWALALLFTLGWWSGAEAQTAGCQAGTTCIQLRAYNPTGAANITATSVSSNVAFASVSSSANLLIKNTGLVTAYIAVGNASIVATTSGIPVAAGDVITIPQGLYTNIAAITATGTTALIIESGSGFPNIVYLNGLGGNSSGAGITIGSTPVIGCSTSGYVLFNNGGFVGCQLGTGTGTVTTLSIASSNGFAGTVANPTTTPIITLTTSITGLLKGNGSAISAAAGGTDYLAPTGSGAALTGLLYSQLPAMAANSLLGALTATTPSALAMPSCSGATNALLWTSGVGFSCNSITAGTGSVTTASVVTANGFAGTVANPTTTPAITLTTTITGLLKGDGTAISLAASGTDYLAPAGSGALLTALNATQLTSGLAAVARGGTGLASGTSGGVLGYTATGTIASSGALTANALVLGGGAGALPSVLGSLGSTTTVLHGNAAGAPTFGAVSLTADVAGNLPVTNLNSGTSASSTTFWAGDGTWRTPTGAGNVSNTGTPTGNQAAEWTSATVIQGVAVTGTGNYVKSSSPTLVTPALGTPSSGNGSNLTNLPIAALTGTVTDTISATWDSTTPVTAQTIDFPIGWATYTITGVKAKVSGGGSFTYAIKINGTAVTSCNVVTVNSASNVNTSCTALNTGSVNDIISIVVAGTAGTVNQAYVSPVFTHTVN